MKIENPDFRLPEGGTGKRVLICEINIAELSVAAMEFNLPNGFDFFEVLIRDIRLTDDDVTMNMQVGDSTNELISDNIYNWMMYRSSLAGGEFTSAVDDNRFALAPTGLALGIGNDLNEGFNSEVIIHNAWNDRVFFHMSAKSVFMDASVSTDISHSLIGGGLSVVRQIDRISFIPSSGNFLSGIFKVYGITGATGGA